MGTTTEDWQLEDYLTDEQKLTWERDGRIIVVASNGQVYALGDGSRVYILRDGKAVNVRNVWATDYRTGDQAPREVSVLTQLLWLQADPDWFLANGCMDGYYWPGEIEGVPEMDGYFVKGYRGAKTKTKAIDDREDYY